MRIPLTLSELSVIRSGGRIFIQLFGVLVLLLGLWGTTIMIDRSMAPLDELPDPIGEEITPTLTFPADINLTHEDGRTMNVILITRPSSEQLTIQRKSDGRTFILDLNILTPASVDEMRKYTLASESDSLQAMIDGFQGRLRLPGRRFELPHRGTLVSTGDG